MRKALNPTQLCERYNISPSTRERRIKDGTLPPPEIFGPRTRRWFEDVLDENDARRVAARDGKVTVTPPNPIIGKRRGRPKGSRNKPKLQEIRADGA